MLLDKCEVSQVNVKGKRVLVRVDYNVPMQNGKVMNNYRIVATIPTLNYLLENGAKSLVILSHLGNPRGQKDRELSLQVLVPEIEKCLGRPIIFLPEGVGHKAEKMCANPIPGSVFLLENLKFHSEEETRSLTENGKEFQAQKEDVLKYCAAFSKLGDIYVNDAFGAVHRSHSSLVGCTLPIRAAGLLLKKELSFLEKALENPNRPFLVILGGSKVSDKIQVIDNLLDKVDALIVAGGMAFTFLKVINKMEIGKSLFDEKGSAIVNGLVAKAKQNNVKLLLPVDFITAPSICQNTDTGTATVCSGIPPDSMGLDIGAESVKMFSKEIRKSRTITWNGPPGVFEFEKFSHGSQQILQFVVEATMGGALTIIGGGDTATCCMKYKCENKVSYVSTGGGASLAVLKGHVLPSVAALTDKM